MSTVYIYDYAKFAPHFDSVAEMEADTSMSYSDTGNKYRIDVGDWVWAGVYTFECAASGASDHDTTTAGGVKLYRRGPDASFVVAVTDETTAIFAGAAQRTFRMPYGMKLTGVKASLNTAQASGDIFTVDINEGGTTLLSTKLTIDNTEKTSETAATPAVISDSALAADAEITIDVDQVGDGSAVGLKVTLIGILT